MKANKAFKAIQEMAKRVIPTTGELIDKDFEIAFSKMKEIGAECKSILINKDMLILYRDFGSKYCCFSDAQINNPSKRSGYIGRRFGIKVYIR